MICSRLLRALSRCIPTQRCFPHTFMCTPDRHLTAGQRSSGLCASWLPTFERTPQTYIRATSPIAIHHQLSANGCAANSRPLAGKFCDLMPGRCLTSLCRQSMQSGKSVLVASRSLQPIHNDSPCLRSRVSRPEHFATRHTTQAIACLHALLLG